MKIFNVIFLLIFSFLLISCSEDNNEDFRFDAKSLKQTTWEGTKLITDGDQVIRSEHILMQFFTIDSGQYIVKQEEGAAETQIYDFKYSIEGKIMKITEAPFSTNWTLVKMDKDKLVLEAFGSYKLTLTLYKKY